MTIEQALPAASQQAAVDAALLILERMGLSPGDLTASPRDRAPVPTFARVRSAENLIAVLRCLYRQAPATTRARHDDPAASYRDRVRHVAQEIRASPFDPRKETRIDRAILAIFDR